ncbi:MAG: 50S ribosomal protein L10 [Bacteroidales bacterium]|nr:50S ribosomal protein L10 [Bacteroidales bacterium]
MRPDEKNKLIDSLAAQLSNNGTIYLADISNLNAEMTSKLRRLCFRRNIQIMVVKNTLLRKAMERSSKDFSPLFDVLKGHTSLMFGETGNAPAKLIKEFRKESDRPILKGAYVEEMTYTGDDQLDALINIKTKNELVADVILLLKSPMNNVMGALQSGGNTIHGVLKTLGERAA